MEEGDDDALYDYDRQVADARDTIVRRRIAEAERRAAVTTRAPLQRRIYQPPSLRDENATVADERSSTSRVRRMDVDAEQANKRRRLLEQEEEEDPQPDDVSAVDTRRVGPILPATVEANPGWRTSPYRDQLTAPRRTSVNEFHESARASVAALGPAAPAPQRAIVGIMNSHPSTHRELQLDMARDAPYNFKYEPTPLMKCKRLMTLLGPSPPAKDCLACRVGLKRETTQQKAALAYLLAMYIRYEAYADEELRYFAMEVFCDLNVIGPHNKSERAIWAQLHPRKPIMPREIEERRIFRRWTARGIYDHYEKHSRDKYIRAIRNQRKMQTLADELYFNGLNVLDCLDPSGTATHIRPEYVKMWLEVAKVASKMDKEVDHALEKAIAEANEATEMLNKEEYPTIRERMNAIVNGTEAGELPIDVNLIKI